LRDAGVALLLEQLGPFVGAILVHVRKLIAESLVEPRKRALDALPLAGEQRGGPFGIHAYCLPATRATNAATSSASLRWSRRAGMRPIPRARPLAMASSTSDLGGLRSSRLGPVLPVVWAAASVWHWLQVRPNSSRPRRSLAVS